MKDFKFNPNHGLGTTSDDDPKTFALTFNYFLLVLMLKSLHLCTTRKLLKLSGLVAFLFILKPPFLNQPYQEDVKTLFSSFLRPLNVNKRTTNTKEIVDCECEWLNTSMCLTCVLRNGTRWLHVRRKTKKSKKEIRSMRSKLCFLLSDISLSLYFPYNYFH